MSFAGDSKVDKNYYRDIFSWLGSGATDWEHMTRRYRRSLSALLTAFEREEVLNVIAGRSILCEDGKYRSPLNAKRFSAFMMPELLYPDMPNPLFTSEPPAILICTATDIIVPSHGIYNIEVMADGESSKEMTKRPGAILLRKNPEDISSATQQAIGSDMTLTEILLESTAMSTGFGINALADMGSALLLDKDGIESANDLEYGKNPNNFNKPNYIHCLHGIHSQVSPHQASAVSHATHSKRLNCFNIAKQVNCNIDQIDGHSDIGTFRAINDSQHDEVNYCDSTSGIEDLNYFKYVERIEDVLADTLVLSRANINTNVPRNHSTSDSDGTSSASHEMSLMDEMHSLEASSDLTDARDVMIVVSANPSLVSGYHHDIPDALQNMDIDLVSIQKIGASGNDSAEPSRPRDTGVLSGVPFQWEHPSDTYTGCLLPPYPQQGGWQYHLGELKCAPGEWKYSPSDDSHLVPPTYAASDIDRGGRMGGIDVDPKTTKTRSPSRRAKGISGLPNDIKAKLVHGYLPDDDDATRLYQVGAGWKETLNLHRFRGPSERIWTNSSYTSYLLESTSSPKWRLCIRCLRREKVLQHKRKRGRTSMNSRTRDYSVRAGPSEKEPPRTDPQVSTDSERKYSATTTSLAVTSSVGATYAEDTRSTPRGRHEVANEGAWTFSGEMYGNPQRKRKGFKYCRRWFCPSCAEHLDRKYPGRVKEWFRLELAANS